ncbi:hypothetical protein [Alkalimonas amylolytica]|uniref:Uncharacterized protein n=1 Tax=Alkalimonas amylolytica TaxID=152573 RepID=A0A1H4D2A7_ALKAM|nr:hypothetical protein [Alkalimonas amylolytica]SEA66569.1 hypothetical protein SAMN04488051_10526 [Alkalimonas amylolytica]
MVWFLIKDSLPIKALLLLLIGLLIAWQGWTAVSIIALSIAVDGILAYYQQRNTTKWTTCNDILALLAIGNDGNLRVGMEKASNPQSVKVELQQDNRYGYLQITLSNNGPLHYRFPLNQLEPLQQWFSTELPDITIAHQLKS